MWNGKKKAVTFSYDDGVTQDRRLVELFNRYQVKATFNLNSGIQSGANKWERKGVVISRMNQKGLKELYAGHEIAVHCLTHASLTDCEEETMYNEIWADKRNLEALFETKVTGMAYPFGRYNDLAVKVLEECGIQYARTTIANASFGRQSDLLRFQPTCHHNDANLWECVERFLASDQEDQIFYIWGHSYEFDQEDNWERMEELLKKLAGRDDIFYGTNREVLLGE